jgi:hypothetical protein
MVKFDFCSEHCGSKVKEVEREKVDRNKQPRELLI